MNGFGRWLGDGLSWASREVATMYGKHQEATRAAPVDNLRRLLFGSDEASDGPSQSLRQSLPQGSASARDARKDLEEVQRRLLMGDGSGSGSGSDTSYRERAGARLAAHRAARDGALARVSGAASSVHQSLEAMHERGDKLSQLGDKSKQLADDADDFAILAKQLRKQQEGGLFGGLFS